MCGFLGITQLVDIKGLMNLCLCGCDQEIKDGNRFIRFHHLFGKQFFRTGPSEEGKQRIRINKIGTKLSQESKDKISQKAKLRWQNPEYRTRLSNAFKKKIGHKNPFFGKRHSSETIKKMLGKRKYHYGKDHHWFKPDRKRNYPLGWTDTLKRAIRERDNYKCQRCGVPQEECQRQLDVHHKDGIKENCNPSNLISLCSKCHSQIEHNPKYQGELK